MGLGISVFLIAVGAILTFAVEVPVSGIDLDVVGVILMAVGSFAFFYSLLWWSDASPLRRNRTVIREQYVQPTLVEPPVYPVGHEHTVVEYERRAS